MRVPRPTVPEKRALGIRTVRDFFAVSAEYGSRADRARDVCEIVFCLAGINTADCIIWKKRTLETERCVTADVRLLIGGMTRRI